MQSINVIPYICAQHLNDLMDDSIKIHSNNDSSRHENAEATPLPILLTKVIGLVRYLACTR